MCNVSAITASIDWNVEIAIYDFRSYVLCDIISLQMFSYRLAYEAISNIRVWA